MKPSRIVRAWRAWLALPEVARIMAVITLVVFVGWLWPRPAKAEDMLVATNGEDTVQLFDRPCTHAGTQIVMIARRIPPKLREQFRAARATVRGEEWFACWMVDGDSAHLIYEDGDQGLIPLTDFALPTTPPVFPPKPAESRKADGA